MEANKKRFKQFMEIEGIGGGDFAEQQFVYVSNASGNLQVYAAPVNDPLQFSRLTTSEDRCTDPHVLKDGSIIYTSDKGGNENFQLFVITKDKQFQLTTDLQAKHRGIHITDDALYTSANLADKQRFDIYRYSLPLTEQQEPEHICDGLPQKIMVVADTLEDKLLLSLVHGNVHIDAMIYDIQEHTYTNLTEKFGAWRFIPHALIDVHHILLTTDYNREFNSLAILNIETKSLTWLEDDNWSTTDVSYHAETKQIFFCKNIEGNSKLFTANLDTTLQNLRELPLPTERGVLTSGDQRTYTRNYVLNEDATKILFTYSSSTLPANIYQMDVKSGNTQQLTQANLAGLLGDEFIPADLQKFLSFDQLEIPYFIYKPREQSHPLPAILMIHGGPEGQMKTGFSNIIQYFATAGYIIVTPNIRGSAGYGKTYLSLDDKEKRLDSIADIKELAVHLQQNDDNVAADKLIIYGGSYGGFAVLSSITEYPNLYAVAIDIVGISNFVTFLENTAPWRRKLREVEYGSLEEDRQMLKTISPIHRVHLIKTPTLIIQGDNDERVPLSEALQIYEKLQENDVPTQLLRFGDEGHGIVKLKNRVVAYTEVLKFIEQHLK